MTVKVILTSLIVLVLLAPTFISMLVYYVKNKEIDIVLLALGLFVFIATFCVIVVFASLFSACYPIVDKLLGG